jgi:hypothetical protein
MRVAAAEPIKNQLKRSKTCWRRLNKEEEEEGLGGSQEKLITPTLGIVLFWAQIWLTLSQCR